MARARLTLETGTYIPALLVSVSNKLSHGASAIYRRTFGIGVTEWRVIALLALEPGIPAHRVCHVIGLDKALVSRTIQTLQNQNYVTVRSEEKDSRRGTVTLTAGGLDLHDRVIKVALEREKLLLQDFTEKEIDTLAKWLRRMHGRIQVVNSYDPELAKAKQKAKTRSPLRRATK